MYFNNLKTAKDVHGCMICMEKSQQFCGCFDQFNSVSGPECCSPLTPIVPLKNQASPQEAPALQMRSQFLWLNWREKREVVEKFEPLNKVCTERQIVTGVIADVYLRPFMNCLPPALYSSFFFCSWEKNNIIFINYTNTTLTQIEDKADI